MTSPMIYIRQIAKQSYVPMVCSHDDYEKNRTVVIKCIHRMSAETSNVTIWYAYFGDIFMPFERICHYHYCVTKLTKPSLNFTFRLWFYTIWPYFIKIRSLVLLDSCLQTKRHRNIDTQTDKSDHNKSSQNLWRGKKKYICARGPSGKVKNCFTSP